MQSEPYCFVPFGTQAAHWQSRGMRASCLQPAGLLVCKDRIGNGIGRAVPRDKVNDMQDEQHANFHRTPPRGLSCGWKHAPLFSQTRSFDVSA